VRRRTLPTLPACLTLLALALSPAGSARAQEASPELGALQPRPSEDAALGVTVLLGPPALTTEQGPLFPLRRIAARLGGPLTEGEGSVTLTLNETPVIAGPGNPVMIVGREIVQLSQAPIEGGAPDDGLLVPLDLLRGSYGALLDYDFTWSAAERELTARRRLPLSLPVSVDVVHLQGVSTLVLQFPERFAYEIVERGDDLEVRPERDRFEPPVPAPRVDDPLVRGVRVSPDRVRVDFAPGTSAESYSLERPFRLVFDVVREEERSAVEEEVPEVEPPQDRPGLDTIVIDPGHGGTETGAIGPSGQQEKELTLALAETLRERLRARLPVRVILTREDDESLPHDTRTAIANQNKADLFISIHLNSSLGSTAQGAETYFLSMEASDARAAEAAAAENRSVERGGDDEDPLYDLQLILWDLAQSHHLEESQRVATLIQEELNTALGLRDRGVKQAPFRVLMGAAMPAVLVELGFLSNPAEEGRLRDPGYRAELVDALVRAIGRYRFELDERATREMARSVGPAEPTP
jgi:N-acetylmuramoyl-L-alanine amidase